MNVALRRPFARKAARLLAATAGIALFGAAAFAIDLGELVRPIAPTTVPAEKGQSPTGPATTQSVAVTQAAAATQPATAPAAAEAEEKNLGEVSAEAKPILDRARDAYQAVKSLRLAGTITGDIDVNGQQENHRASFTASYRAPSAATRPAEFRHAQHEDADGGPATRESSAKDATLVGGTGSRLYVFEPKYNYFYSADAPKDRKIQSLGNQIAPLLEKQNLSLLYALIDDAAVEMASNVERVDKVEDVKIADVACPAVKVTVDKSTVFKVAFDPKSNLVRRVTWDYKGLAEARKQLDVKKVLVTVDYATTEVNADLSAETFAWAPPAGARDVTAMADADNGDDDQGPPEAAHAELIGKPAPDFTLPGLDGKSVKLSSLKGSVVVLDFWATWCGPCRASLPKLDEIYQSLKDKGLKAYAVDLREDEAGVKAFVEESKLGIPVLLDKDGKVAKSFAVSGIPQTVVVGKDGKIKKIVVGSGTHEQVRQAVEDAMK